MEWFMCTNKFIIDKSVIFRLLLKYPANVPGLQSHNCFKKNVDKWAHLGTCIALRVIFP